MAISPFHFLDFLLFGLLLLIHTKYSNGSNNVKCIENSRFYRDPDRPAHKIWTSDECAKYYLCLDNEVFAFRCSSGLMFDVNRQICDFKLNVENCDVTTEIVIPKPLLDEAECPDLDAKQLGCADGTCLPEDYFCDGSMDCLDGSDEGWCDMDHDPNAASPCDPATCKLPDCFCSKDGTEIPGDLEPFETPQIILLTFDDAINSENWDLYVNKLFTRDRRNPNGCHIKATFFVSHQYTNYQHVQKMWNDGHEIAVHSITHRGPEEWWSKNATIEDWFDEMIGQANILHRFANIRMEDIRGLRVPFLRIGWNRQFLMMKEFGFVYDSSMVAPFQNPPLWPYTLDHQIPHMCTGDKQYCLTRSYPRIWEMVINQLESNENTCAIIDSCSDHLTGEDLYKMLYHNFKRHYMSNRAPFGLHFQTAWLKNPEYLHAFTKFLDELLESPDVWFVTNSQAIEWIKNPVPLSQLHNFKAWKCKKPFEESELVCDLPNVCKLYSRIHQQDRLLYTCTDCPQQYPWIRNEFGMN